MQSGVAEAELTRFLESWMAARQLIQAANFNRFHKEGLSATQFMTLNVLPERGAAMSMGELARLLNLKPATVAQTINSLEERGLVMRQRGEQDRRQVLLCITEKGARLQNTASGQFKNQMSAIFARMEPGKRGELVAGLEQFVQVGQALQAEAVTAADPDAAPLVERSS